LLTSQSGRTSLTAMPAPCLSAYVPELHCAVKFCITKPLCKMRDCHSGHDFLRGSIHWLQYCSDDDGKPALKWHKTTVNVSYSQDAKNPFDNVCVVGGTVYYYDIIFANEMPFWLCPLPKDSFIMCKRGAVGIFTSTTDRNVKRKRDQ